MKNNTIIFLSVSSLLLILFSGCINDNDNQPNDWWEKEVIHYEIKLEINISEDYELILPVPLISRVNNPKIGTPIQLMNELNLKEGDAYYTITNTSYGYGLKITSKSNITLFGQIEFENESVENDDDYVFDDLSMKSGNKYDSANYI